MPDNLITKKIITLTFKDGSVEQVQVIEEKGDTFDIDEDNRRYRFECPRLDLYQWWLASEVRGQKLKITQVPEAEALTTEQKAEKVRSPYDFELK